MASAIAALLAALVMPPQDRTADAWPAYWSTLEQRGAALLAAATTSESELTAFASALVDLLYDPATESLELRPFLDQLGRCGRPVAKRAGESIALLFEYELASSALLRGDAALARDLLVPARVRWPDDIGLIALDAEQAMQLGAWSDAKERLVAGEASDSSDAVATALLELERILFEVKLGRADRALLALERLLARPDLDPAIAALARAREVDLYLLCDRPTDAEYVAGAHDEWVSELALGGRIARAATPAGRRDRALRDELLRAAALPGLGFAPKCVARLAAAEISLAIGELAAAKVTLDRLAAELDGLSKHDDRPSHRRERTWCMALQARSLRATATAAARNDAAALANAAFEELLAEWRETPLLPGGISFLRSASRRTVIHEAIEAAMDAHDPNDANDANDGAATGGSAGSAGSAGSEINAVRVFELFMRVQAQGSLARQLGLAAPDLATVRRELLSDHELLLIYLPTDEATHLLAITADSLEHAQLAPTPPLHALLPPALRARVAAASHVRIVGAELLDHPPFETLELEPGTLLGVVKPLSLLPSVPIGVWLRRRESRRPRAPPAIEWRIGPGESVDGRSHFRVDPAALYGSLATAHVRAGEVASDPAAWLAEWRGDVAVFLAHGVIDRERDRFAGLLLARAADGTPTIAWADAFAAAHLPPLVVLAACSSGEGPVRVGEDGSEHLGGAALLGGADTVLVGRGDLDVAAAIALLQPLLRGIERGLAPAEALRSARSAVAGARTATSPPIRVELIGLADTPLRPIADPTEEVAAEVTEELVDGERARTPASSPRTLVTAGVLLTLAGAALLWRTRGAARPGTSTDT